MADLNAFWRELLAGERVLADRPSFRFDPAFYASAYSDLSGSAAELKHHFSQHGNDEGRFPNRFQQLKAAHPDLGKRVRRLVVDPTLKTAMGAKQGAIAELAFELMRLGRDSQISNFSSKHYLLTNPDVAAAGVDPLEHYLLHGHREGRTTLAKLRRGQHKGSQVFDPDRPTCLIAVHELSKTGAPYVGLDLAREASSTHNVIVSALRGGPLLDAMKATACMVAITPNPAAEFNFFRGEMFDAIDVAICNSVETYPFIPVLVERVVPFLSYVHEYTWYTFPTYKSVHTALFADVVVFSSTHVKDSWLPFLQDAEVDVDRDVAILPQREARFSAVTSVRHRSAVARLSELVGFDCSGRRIVCGAGQAQWRKGTDLFVSTSQIAKRVDPDSLFIWVGDGISHEDSQFGAWLTHHLREAGAGRDDSNLFMLPAGDHYHDVLDAADVFLLTSRLDPLPNVVFDALERGCQVVAFDGGTGFVDETYTAQGLVTPVEYGNPDAAASAVLRVSPKPLATDHVEDDRQPRVFPRLLEILEQRSQAMSSFVIGPTSLDVPLMYTSSDEDRDRRTREREKLFTGGRRYLWRDAEDASASLAASTNWVHQSCDVVDFSLADVRALPDFSIHLHAYYVDNLAAEVRSHVIYTFATRIYVTTDSDKKAKRVQKAFDSSGLSAEVVVVPNVGRDILPFLDLFRPTGPGRSEELWCHVHRKKSLTSTAGGDVWRDFMTSILLGNDHGVSAAPSLAMQPHVGLVAALDPFYGQWNASRALLPSFADRFHEPLPNNPMVYPMGNMFWVRGSVVEAMIDVFGSDYPWPNEPIPNDGTEFHLIERLWPAVAAQSGYQSLFMSKPDQTRRI